MNPDILDLFRDELKSINKDYPNILSDHIKGKITVNKFIKFAIERKPKGMMERIARLQGIHFGAQIANLSQ